MERKTHPITASAVARLCAWPVPAMLLALCHTSGPAHALLEGGSSAPLPGIASAVAAPVPEPDLWLSPTDRARGDWRRAVCAGPGYPMGDTSFGDYARSANGTLVPAAMAPMVLSDARAKRLRPTRRPSYILAAHLIPRDPATVRPVKRPLPDPVLMARMWQGPAVRTAAFGPPGVVDGLWGGSSGIALWRAYLCNDADGTLAMAGTGFGTGASLTPAAARSVPERYIRPVRRDRRPAITPTVLGWSGGGSGTPGALPLVVVPPVGAPGGPPPGDPAFPPSAGPGDTGGPVASPWPPGPGTPPGSPPIDPGKPPPAADPAPVPLPASLLLLLTACAGLVFGRRVTSFRRAS